MKIKYDLQVFHSIVLFKVLEMDEKYRNKNCTSLNLFTSSNGFEIISGGFIGLYSKSIFVLGNDKEVDGLVDDIRFDSNQEAQEYADKIRFALEEWNNHVEIMEIEYEVGDFTNNGYVIDIYEASNYATISIAKYNNKGDSLKKYWVSDDESYGIPLDKTIIMFNRDCELLNIPFRIKGEK